MSNIKRYLRQVERSLSNLSCHLGLVIIDGPDAKSKLHGLEANIEKVERRTRD